MNAITMMAQQMQVPGKASAKLSDKTKDSSDAGFQGLLTKMQAVMGTDGNIQLDDDQTMNIMAVLQKLMKMNPELLEKMGISLDDIKQLAADGASSKEDADQLAKLLDQLLSNEQNDDGSEIPFEQVWINFQTVIPAGSNGQTFVEKFNKLAKQVKQIFENISKGNDLKKQASSLLKLLEQWTALEKKALSTGAETKPYVQPSAFGGERGQAVWRDILQSFQKRNQFVHQSQYNSNAKVSSEDVAKWLGKALSDIGQADKSVQPQHISMTNMAMSKVEQYMIYMNQNQSTQAPDQQLMEQFQKIMQTSKFLSSNGTTQLSITLKPGNLGEMMVKMTQINGEMAVKIIVSSQAAKDMLESNIHQLKHMFSPQHVLIEKQDLTPGTAQSFRDDANNQSMGDEQQDNSDNQSNDNKKNQSSDDYEVLFQEILNEKV